MTLNTIAIIQNTSTDPNDTVLDQVRAFWESHGKTVWHSSTQHQACPVLPPEAPRPDLVMVLGGDGTFLRAARCFAEGFNHEQVPLIGVNTGTLGFLARIDRQRIDDCLQQLLADSYTLEHRLMLSVGNRDDQSNNPSSKPVSETLALNDIVIKNQNPNRMAALRFYIDGFLVADYNADGLIIATPTGSTAYNLAAGGPIIAPDVPCISITPICPHSFSAKPIVVSAERHLWIEPAQGTPTRPAASLTVSIDGEEPNPLNPGDCLTISKADLTLPMVCLQGNNTNGNQQDSPAPFYTMLKTKLDWAKNPRLPPI